MNNRIKYPRSWHLSYSEKSGSDDKRHDDDSHFSNKNVTVTIKLDGENTTIYSDYIHARSLDSRVDSEDRRWIDALRISKIENNIPDSFRICGENMFYKHTVPYEDLESMFYVFSIWDGDKCLSWEETKMWCGLLDLQHVPVIFEGKYNKDKILKIFNDYTSKNKNVEGFVVRISDSFNISEFTYSLSKYVRNTFEIPSNHWRHSQKYLNALKSSKNPWDII